MSAGIGSFIYVVAKRRLQFVVPSWLVMLFNALKASVSGRPFILCHIAIN